MTGDRHLGNGSERRRCTRRPGRKGKNELPFPISRGKCLAGSQEGERRVRIRFSSETRSSSRGHGLQRRKKQQQRRRGRPVPLAALECLRKDSHLYSKREAASPLLRNEKDSGNCHGERKVAAALALLKEPVRGEGRTLAYTDRRKEDTRKDIPEVKRGKEMNFTEENLKGERKTKGEGQNATSSQEMSIGDLSSQARRGGGGPSTPIRREMATQWLDDWRRSSV